VRDLFSEFDEPTDAELDEIVDESPLIAAELVWLDAEILLLLAEERGGPLPLDWKRLRVAEALVTREFLAWINRINHKPLPRRAA
jgi:hypothetical protein